MKFTDKYELLESLTTGAVETFIANDKVRGERVLVHIVESAPQKAGQSTLEWVMESFRRVAPEPAGPVLETGKYAEPKYVYVVTKPVDESAQTRWVRRYEIQSLDTQETITRPTTVEKSPSPVALPSAIEPERAPVSMTQLLRDFDSQIKPPAKPKKDEPPARPQPSLNVMGDQSGLHSAPPWEPVRQQVPVPAKEADPRGAREPDSFGKKSKDAGFPSATFPTASKAGIRDASRPGEFTSFFQGPFRGDGPSDVPSLSSQPIEPPHKTVGEFTAVFGSAGRNQEPSAPQPEASGNTPAPSTFTGIFKDIQVVPRSAQPSSPPSLIAPTPLDPLPIPKVPSPAPVSVAPPTKPPKLDVLPPLPTPSSEMPAIAKPNSLPGEGATGAFSRPAVDVAAPVMSAPVGPSPYTQIVSRDKVIAESADASGEEDSPPAKFASPPMPKGPAAPKVPQVKMPPPPKLAVPKAPKIPKMGAPASPSVSMMPVVITVTVLFLLAVVVVLYFVLKR